MSTRPNRPCFGFVVDTDTYAGNFERPLVAWMTGHIGDCGVGEEHVEKDVLDRFDGQVLSVPDEHGCQRPATIWSTPGYYNTGMGVAYKAGGEQDALVRHIQRVKNYYEPLIARNEDTRAKLQSGEKVGNWTIEAVDRENAIHRATIDKAVIATAPGKYPSYQSVLAYFYDRPSEEDCRFMADRAKTFVPGKYDGTFKILGFRLIEFVFQEKEIPLTLDF